VGFIRATKEDLERSKEEQLILDAENSKGKKTDFKKTDFTETELANEIQVKKANHIFPLIILIFIAGVFIVLSSNGKKNNNKKNTYLTKPKATNVANKEANITIDKTQRLIKLTEMLQKKLITEDEFKTLKAKMLSE
jgi:cbb3-type cytochrome oxidase subunit 3